MTTEFGVDPIPDYPTEEPRIGVSPVSMGGLVAEDIRAATMELIKAEALGGLACRSCKSKSMARITAKLHCCFQQLIGVSPNKAGAWHDDLWLTSIAIDYRHTSMRHCLDRRDSKVLCSLRMVAGSAVAGRMPEDTSAVEKLPHVFRGDIGGDLNVGPPCCPVEVRQIRATRLVSMGHSG